MDDFIIESIPWDCGGSEGCKTRWHLASYWQYSDGTHGVDPYSDGDHDPVDAEEIPTPEATRAAEHEYTEYVAQTGQDPLGYYTPQQTEKVTRRVWQVEFRRWIGTKRHGLLIAGARRRGRGPMLPVEELPEDVKLFLLAEKCGRFWVCPDLHSLDELDNAEVVKACKPKRNMRRVYCEIEERRPIKQLRRSVKASARRALEKLT